MGWQDETCETCRNRIDTECRRYPPNGVANSLAYPQVQAMQSMGRHVRGMRLEYLPACAEHAPREGEACDR